MIDPDLSYVADTEARKLEGRDAFDPRENMEQLVARRRSDRVLDPSVQVVQGG